MYNLSVKASKMELGLQPRKVVGICDDCISGIHPQAAVFTTKHKKQKQLLAHAFKFSMEKEINQANMNHQRRC